MSVAVLNGYPLDGPLRRRLESVSDHLRITHQTIDDQDTIDSIDGSDVEVLLADFVPSDRSKWPRLRWLQYSGAGVDALTDAAPWRSGILVTTASGGNSVAIGEYVLAWLLHISQQVAELLENQRDRTWASTRLALGGHGLRGRTLALVGYGSVGREVARLARPFGIRVLAVKARPDDKLDPGYRWPGTGDPDGSIPERITGLEGLPQVVAEADFVLIAAPLTPATRGSLGRAVLGALRPDAWLINVARGDIFDETDLVAALRDRRFGGAILDVTSSEPLDKRSPLWALPNVVVTPHVAGLSRGTWDSLSELFRQNLARYSAGEPLFNVVDVDRGY